MAEITFFELHLDDASFTAHAPFSGSEAVEPGPKRGMGRFLSGRGTDEDEAEAIAAESDGGGGGPNPLPALLGLVALAVVAFALRRIVGGEREPVPAQ